MKEIINVDYNFEHDLAQDWFISAWPDAVRWALVVPGAILGSILIPAVIYALASTGSDSGPVAKGSFLDVIYRIAQAIALGSLYVYLGAAIAPKKQLYTGFILFVTMAPLLLVLGMIFLSMPAGSTHDLTDSSNFLVFSLVLTYFSGAGALYYLYRELKH